jgi:hypothetical protein
MKVFRIQQGPTVYVGAPDNIDIRMLDIESLLDDHVFCESDMLHVEVEDVTEDGYLPVVFVNLEGNEIEEEDFEEINRKLAEAAAEVQR